MQPIRRQARRRNFPGRIRRGRAVAVGRDRKRFGVEEGAGVVDEIHPQTGQPAPFFPAIGRLSQEKGKVTIFGLARRASGPPRNVSTSHGGVSATF